jgi:hypothetical protein
LSDYLCEQSKTPFKYGVFDCGLFTAGAIEAMTECDVAASLRNRYRSRTEAFEAIREMCGTPKMQDAATYLASLFGLPQIPPPMAQRGDPIQLRRGSRASLGIVSMHGTDILTTYSGGILRIPLSHAVRAWRV